MFYIIHSQLLQRICICPLLPPFQPTMPPLPPAALAALGSVGSGGSDASKLTAASPHLNPAFLQDMTQSGTNMVSILAVCPKCCD